MDRSSNRRSRFVDDDRGPATASATISRSGV